MEDCFLGIDTSNYTTSAALYDGEAIIQCKELLKVKEGAIGLKQSDAVFSHTMQLPRLMEELMKGQTGRLKGIGVSSRPRNVEGSYMPCFMVGMSVGRCLAATENIPLYTTAHQLGHIMAALYSIKKLELRHEPFLAFHVSGGTTEALLVTPDEQEILKAEIVAKSLDLKAGQAIDRVGVLLGLPFPAGAALDELSRRSTKNISVRPTVKGLDCCLSGLENQCKKLFDAGENPEDIANFCIQYIMETLDVMTAGLRREYGRLPLVYAGGVMSNSKIRAALTEKYGAFFAEPRFSSDNAAGVAILASLKAEGAKGGICDA